MAYQRLIRPAHLDLLEQYVKEGKELERYLEKVFPVNEDYILVTPQVEEPLGLNERLDPKDDFKSAVELYKAYKSLSPIQASDSYFWESLTHLDLFDYTKERWSLDKSKLSSKMILDHWFVSSGYYRHSLASLWWSVYLTVDDKLQNPYELTEVFFGNQTFRTRTYGTSLVSRIREANIGILRYLKEHDDMTATFDLTGRAISSYFNRLGAVKQLACMDRDFFYNEMKKAHNDIMRDVERRKERRASGDSQDQENDD
jgi:hypothetical protein